MASSIGFKRAFKTGCEIQPLSFKTYSVEKMKDRQSIFDHIPRKITAIPQEGIVSMGGSGLV